MRGSPKPHPSNLQHSFISGSLASLLLSFGFGQVFVQPDRAMAQSSPPIRANPTLAPSPGQIVRPVLRSGSRGAEVTELQATLKLLGFYNNAVDGVYGKATIAAVTDFQQAAGLTSDGVVGTATWNRLFPPMSGAIANNPAPANVAPNAPAPNAANQPSESATFPVLRFGARGSAVMGLQERLQALGFYKFAIDGVFGKETESAVRAFQRGAGLQPDGVVGGITWDTLLRRSN
jgi:peptidoglycan hydrolase-like protein with peptidoglycan-binding domain